MTEYPQHSSASAPTGDDSTSAKQKASEAAQTGRQAAGEVAQTASGAAKDVAHETGKQARELLGKTRQQVSEQAGEQQGAVVDNLRSIVDQLSAMTSNVDSDNEGVAVELAVQARDRARDAADWLDGREPSAVLDELRNFGRQRPGAFLLGAAVAGVVAGRLTRGVAAVHTEDNGDDGKHVLGSGADSETTAPLASGAPAGRPASDRLPEQAPTGYQAGSQVIR